MILMNSNVMKFLVIVYILTISTAQAATIEQQKGYDIAARSDRSDVGFGDSDVRLEMVLRNEAGQQTSRLLSIKTQEKENEQVGDKSLIVFDTPRDVEGTALLSHAKLLESDQQWLFLPALKRVKRISSANKSGPFVSSEFAFEDLTINELNKFSYAYVGEETYQDRLTDIIDRFPRYERSGYTRQRVWIDQNDWQPRKVVFYDRKGDLLKTLQLSDYRNYNGVWRAHLLEMSNHQSGKATQLIYGDYLFKTGISARKFSKGSLKQLR